MASTYALPLNSTSHSHSHGHSRSQYLSDRRPSMNGNANLTSPSKMNNNINHNGHTHATSSEMGKQLVSPYGADHEHGHDHDHDHDHTHNYSKSDSSYALKSIVGGRPRARPRGESDLGRPVSRKSSKPSGYGFSPIQEAPAPVFPAPSAIFLELPEALTALLIPIPYLLASLAYPSVVGGLPSRNDILLDTTAKESEALLSQVVPNGSALLHALTLSSTTLLLVGLISKIRSTEDQPLDRRKGAERPERFGVSLDTFLEVQSISRIGTSICSVFLPFYAAMHLGGVRTALVLLAAASAGLGSLDHRPGRHTLWDTWKRTFRTRKGTTFVLVLGIVVDAATSPNLTAVLIGYLALLVSVLAIPPPLPTTGWSILTGAQGGDAPFMGQGSSRMALPKPSSPLTSSPQDALLTAVAGVFLTVITILYSLVSSSSPSISQHSIFCSTLSVASATASVFFSSPTALRSKRKAGLALGCLLTAVFGVAFAFDKVQAWMYVPSPCIAIFLTVSADTRTPAPSHAHSHGHAHTGHKHTHAKEHHLHGNHSRLSAFLIARCTPGSILHSILLEKDSRRIAYFGVLNLSFMMVQFFYGFVSGSLGLLTDSIHMLFDCAGLAVGLAAAVMSKWAPNAKFPYGYGKIDTLSGFANGVFLLLVSVEIIFDAFERLWEGHELQRLNELLIVSVLGFLVNIVGLTAFGHAHHGHGHSHDHDHGDADHGHSHGHSHSHDNENMQGIFLHILADALGSVAVIISTLLTKYYGWSGWDPIASSIIAILIFASAIPLVKTSGMRLLLSLPADVEYGIRNTLQELSSLRGVVGYTVPRFWLEDEGAAHSEVHAKEQDHCDHSHDHGHDHAHGHDHDHAGHGHSHSGHNHDHAHSHSHSHSPSHDHHDHDHDHDHHDHAPRGQRVLGVIHIIASSAANLEDVRERTVQFLKGRGLDVVVHVETEGEGRCWCGGGNKTI